MHISFPASSPGVNLEGLTLNTKKQSSHTVGTYKVLSAYWLCTTVVTYFRLRWALKEVKFLG